MYSTPVVLKVHGGYLKEKFLKGSLGVWDGKKEWSERNSGFSMS